MSGGSDGSRSKTEEGEQDVEYMLLLPVAGRRCSSFGLRLRLRLASLCVASAPIRRLQPKDRRASPQKAERV